MKKLLKLQALRHTNQLLSGKRKETWNPIRACTALTVKSAPRGTLNARMQVQFEFHALNENLNLRCPYCQLPGAQRSKVHGIRTKYTGCLDALYSTVHIYRLTRHQNRPDDSALEGKQNTLRPMQRKSGCLPLRCLHLLHLHIRCVNLVSLGVVLPGARHKQKIR